MNVAVKLLAFAALILCSQPLLAAAQKSRDKTKHIPRTIWNFEGGVFLETDGGVSENTCFRLAGRMVAKDFFDDLKRVDDDDGTVFLRGKEPITEFPIASSCFSSSAIIRARRNCMTSPDAFTSLAK